MSEREIQLLAKALYDLLKDAGYDMSKYKRDGHPPSKTAHTAVGFSAKSGVKTYKA